MHDVTGLAAQSGSPAPALPGRPRILSLELQSGAPLGDMKAFYGKTLDLRILEEKPDRFTVEAGETRITFVGSTDTVDGRSPFYHFAFNIPENKILKALEWQKARTPMLPIPERNRAAGFPPEVVDYSHWNAHSIFFLDPAGNVVEYIARHDLKNADSDAFSWTDILYASEIALVVDDVAADGGEVGGSGGRDAVQGRHRPVHGDGRRVRAAAHHEARPRHRLHVQSPQRRARVSHGRHRPRTEDDHVSSSRTIPISLA